KETAEIINQKTNIEIIESDLLKEIVYGEWNNKTVSERGSEYDEYKKVIKNNPEERFKYRLGLTGESRKNVMERTIEFIKEISSSKYAGKTVLVVAHGINFATMRMYFERLSTSDYFKNNAEEADHNLISTFYFGEGGQLFDLHKDKLDGLECKCEKCGGAMKRVPDVLDTWFDSGSMPYAQKHYPFENQEKFENGFPAEFIAEGVDQTRAWFYYLHLIATAIKDKNAFNNVIVNGIVLAEDGKKMSKRLKNYPDPTYLFDKYGADAVRFYLMSSPVVAADNLNFKESDVADLVRGMFRMLWNSYSFFALYANIDGFDPKKEKVKSENLLDKWILSELNILIKEVDENMEKYDLSRTARLFPKFIDNLSNWYIRRSRKRFWKSENDADKDFAYQTLHTVLVELLKLMAPFTPFMSEEIYKNLTGETSVHLAQFPVADERLIDEKLNDKMEKVRDIISLGLQLRAQAKIKVRQPLSEIQVLVQTLEKGQSLGDEFDSMIEEELNVKDVKMIYQNPAWFIEGDENNEWIHGEIKGLHLFLNIKITPELKLEGQAREIVRFIQEMRKEAGYEVENHISVQFEGMEEVFEKFSDLIAKETLADAIEKGAGEDFDLKKELEVDEMKVSISVKK
ncbi:MAG: class I tRNA ligase family protein, partial [Candidatus Moranbacteria bacterium]|nr:class I tRNA ligase family protein [Candidatus Moranbacteria bacterium]